MTFESTAWAIDGSLLTSSLARRASYAATNGANGIVHKGDLKVSQLNVPGVGILIAPGVGLVVNDYQDVPNETYVVSNPSVHVVPSIQMPAANPSAKSFIVAATVGDPDFTQTGHPWMGAGDPPLGEELTFQYVRVSLIEVPAGTTTLDVSYPALPLARIDIPANTTTIIDSYIKDLRKLSQPRQSQEIFVSPSNAFSPAAPIPSGSGYADWSTWKPSVQIPTWATRAIVVASINGVRLTDSSVNISGAVRTQLGSASGQQVTFDMPTGRVGAQRDNLQTGSTYNVSAIAGTTAALRVEGFENVPASPTANQKLTLQSGSQIIFDVRFFEE